VIVFFPFAFSPVCTDELCHLQDHTDTFEEFGATVLCVSTDKRYDGIQGLEDVNEFLQKEIQHFFERYKDLEPNKWVKGEGWEGKETAERLIVEAQQRFQQSQYDNAAEAEQDD